DLNAGMFGQPLSKHFGSSRRPQLHRTPRFEVAHNGSVSHTLAPSPVVDAHNTQVRCRGELHAVEKTQNRVRADGGVEVLGQPGTCFAAQEDSDTGQEVV